MFGLTEASARQRAVRAADSSAVAEGDVVMESTPVLFWSFRVWLPDVGVEQNRRRRGR